MMGPGFSDSLAGAFVAAVALVVCVAFALGGLAVWGLPKLWSWVKPFIHALTA